MRVDANPYTNAVNGRQGAGRAASGVPFDPVMPQIAKSQPMAPMAATANIGALLSIQAADDPLNGRRHAIRRGRSLLDKLDEIRGALLVGSVDESSLDGLMTLVAEGRQRGEPDLDALLDDIELRVRVELAKFGRFPA